MPSSVAERLGRRITDPLGHSRLFLVVDAVCWLIAGLIFVTARYDFLLNDDQWLSAFWYIVVAIVLQMMLGWVSKVYRGLTLPGSFLEASALVTTVIALWVVLGIVFGLVWPVVPRGFVATVLFGALVLMMGARFFLRAMRRRQLLRAERPHAEDVLIYGAGNAGGQLGQQLLTYNDAPYRVAGYIDEDPSKRYLHLGGSRVVGSRADLVDQAREADVATVVLAITNADAQFIVELKKELAAAGIRLLVLPPLNEIVGGRVRVSDIREVDINDILGRHPITTDLSSIADYLTGKVVLITGAGGSIGSEIARQVHAFGPKELVCLDRDESALHGVQLSIYGKGLLDTPDMVLCDIRDLEALDAVFAAHRPDVVFHAAALKHLPMLEQYPEEGWKTNVLGSLNVLRCAEKYGVARYVNISTDKAADPSSILGLTKRFAERLTAWYAEQGAGNYVSVRFGNVLGSRGSVLHTFHAQIEKGGPVTVVHPDITRYFMTIPEACQLVLQAGVLGRPGDVMVFDMGTPVKILDVANQLIEASGKPVEVVFTGLRPGEKMHEVLFSEREAPTPMDHPLISRVHVPAGSPDEIDQLHPVLSAPVEERSAARDKELVA